MAYACEVGKGTEPGFGWGWARALSDAGHDVTVLTRTEGRQANDRWHASHPGTSMRLEYVEVPRLVKPLVTYANAVKVCHWFVYLVWQRVALRRARELHRQTAFDVAHHVTYASIVPGTSLTDLGIPVVFGPLGSGQRAPRSTWRVFGANLPKELIRSAVVSAPTMRMNPLARRSARKADLVLATNDDTARVAARLGASRVDVMCDTGIDSSLIRDHKPLDTARVRRIVWVGKLIPRKGLPLALAAVRQAQDRVPLELTIAGDGMLAGHVATWCTELGLDGQVRRLGVIPWDDVQNLYDAGDVLLFTSIRESFGSQLVEAAAAGLPIVAVGLHGVESLVPNDVAIKVPIPDEATAVAGLADGLVALLTDPALHARMSRASTQFARSMAWPERARYATSWYEKLVDERATRPSA